MLKQVVLLALLVVQTASYAVQPSSDMQFGAIQISNSTQKKLYHSGMLELQSVTMEDAAVINGYLMAKNSTFKELTVNGQCQLENSKLNGPTSINGQMQLKNVDASAALTVYGFLGARNSLFDALLTVTSSNIDLIDSNAQNINIEGVKGEKQTLNLTRTTVNGNIVFASGKGIVKMDPESSIKGKVSGGTIEKVASKPKAEEKKN